MSLGRRVKLVHRARKLNTLEVDRARAFEPLNSYLFFFFSRNQKQRQNQYQQKREDLTLNMPFLYVQVFCLLSSYPIPLVSLLYVSEGGGMGCP